MMKLKKDAENALLIYLYRDSHSIATGKRMKSVNKLFSN